jgi:hypothetical protein
MLRVELLEIALVGFLVFMAGLKVFDAEFEVMKNIFIGWIAGGLYMRLAIMGKKDMFGKGKDD